MGVERELRDTPSRKYSRIICSLLEHALSLGPEKEKVVVTVQRGDLAPPGGPSDYVGAM